VQNHLLAAILAEASVRILPHLELVRLPLGTVLCESGGQLQYVYFPTTAIVTLHIIMKDGATSEIAGVGNEGVIGISLLMGGDTTPSRAMVYIDGLCYRLKARLMIEEFNRAGPSMHLMLRYTQSLITQIAQTAVCTAFSVHQQLCRGLLTLDRSPQ
jgi:hypothetical protein